MEVDVIYRVPDSQCHTHIKSLVRPESISMAVCSSFLDFFLVKRCIWNMISRVESGGVLAIESSPEYLSNVLSLISSQGWSYDILYFQINDTATPIVLAYEYDWYYSPGDKVFKCDYSSYVSYLINSYTIVGSTILLVGGTAVGMSCVAKILGRSVIAIGESDGLKISSVRDSGINEGII